MPGRKKLFLSLTVFVGNGYILKCLMGQIYRGDQTIVDFKVKQNISNSGWC